MLVQQKTLEKLRTLINEETEYRSGPNLVKFFNSLGSIDSYGQGFPSRWIYTDSKLTEINGKPELDACIRTLFAPVNYIGRFDELDKLITDFNQYLAFDGWQVIRKGKDISFVKAGEIKFETKSNEVTEDSFLKHEFSDFSLEKLNFDSTILSVLKIRADEIKKCLSVKACLSAIFLCGSSLEGILLGLATKYPQDFNQAKSSPKDKYDKVLPLYNWSLASFIDVAYELDFIKDDVKKFSHGLRDFRNYIHPYQQVSSRFDPDENTAKICWQVLKASVSQISKKISK